MFFPSTGGLNSTFVILSVYWVLLGTVSVFAGFSAMEHHELFVPGPQAGAPDFRYIELDDNMRKGLLAYYEWFNRLDLTDVINSMQMNTVSPEQHGVLLEFFLYSSHIIHRLQSLVNRGLLIDDQSVLVVNLLVEVKHTISDYFTRVGEEGNHFWRYTFRLPGWEYRNLDEIGLFVDRMQDALFSINLLVGNLPEVEVLPPL